MVVGPPGTGKTDTAVQIMHVLYHNCPGQRTLLITHSNQALNDLFEKILERDVPARSAILLSDKSLVRQHCIQDVARHCWHCCIPRPWCLHFISHLPFQLMSNVTPCLLR